MKKILVIEDNLEMRENIAEILELSNYEVFEAADGKAGVKLAKNKFPDLIICDIMMPELDGYEVLYMLGKDPRTNAIPFIFLTAKAEKSDFRKGMNLGADDYLTKPFEEMDLLNTVEQRLKKTQALRQEFKPSVDGYYNFVEQASAFEELQELSKNRKSRNYRKKDIIYREGDFPHYLYLIHYGKVKTFKINTDGKEYINELCKEGDFTGYTGILQNTDYTATAEALENTEVYLIPRHDFLNLLYQNKEVAGRFIKILSKNIAEKERQLLDLAYNTVRKRVADSLLLLKKRYQEQNNTAFTFPISRDDLASIVGTATESVIRTLSEFKKDQIINIDADGITILKPEELAAIR